RAKSSGTTWMPIWATGSEARQNANEVRKLVRLRQAVDTVAQIGIQVVPLDLALVSAMATRSQHHGLLAGDALIVATMEQLGLTELASNDADFDGVTGLTRYGPG